MLFAPVFSLRPGSGPKPGEPPPRPFGSVPKKSPKEKIILQLLDGKVAHHWGRGPFGHAVATNQGGSLVTDDNRRVEQQQFIDKIPAQEGTVHSGASLDKHRSDTLPAEDAKRCLEINPSLTIQGQPQDPGPCLDQCLLAV